MVRSALLQVKTAPALFFALLGLEWDEKANEGWTKKEKAKKKRAETLERMQKRDEAERKRKARAEAKSKSGPGAGDSKTPIQIEDVTDELDDDVPSDEKSELPDADDSEDDEAEIAEIEARLKPPAPAVVPSPGAVVPPAGKRRAVAVDYLVRAQAALALSKLIVLGDVILKDEQHTALVSSLVEILTVYKDEHTRKPKKPAVASPTVTTAPIALTDTKASTVKVEELNGNETDVPLGAEIADAEAEEEWSGSSDTRLGVIGRDCVRFSIESLAYLTLQVESKKFLASHANGEHLRVLSWYSSLDALANSERLTDLYQQSVDETAGDDASAAAAGSGGGDKSKTKRVAKSKPKQPANKSSTVENSAATSVNASVRFGLLQIWRNLSVSEDDLKKEYDSEVEQLRQLASRGLPDTSEFNH